MMKSTFKSLFSLLLLTAAMSMNAEDVVTAQLCKPSTFLFGCQQFTATGVYPGIDVGGETKTLNLRIGAPSSSAVEATIRPGERFLFGCDILTVADTYQQTLTNASGCDSTVTLTLKMEEPCTPTSKAIEANLQLGKTYLFHCQPITPTAVGDMEVSDTLVNAAGCDSIVTLTLHVLDEACTPIAYAIEATINSGENYLFGCRTLTEAGEYTDTLVNAAGCDSIVTLTLKLNDACTPTSKAIEANLQLGKTYLFHCQPITPTAVGDMEVSDTLVNAAGCDSIVTLTLHVLDEACTPSAYAIEATINSGENYLFGCRTLTEAGEYTDTLVNAAGCDSIVTLTLKVDDGCTSTNKAIEANLQLGNTYLFHCLPITPTAVGDMEVSDTLVNAAGCDSIVTLTLHVLDEACTPSAYAIEATINSGENYLFGCRTLTEAGEYTDTLVNAAGCDSIVTLTLMISDEEVYNTLVEAEVEVDGTFLFGCDRITAAGTYFDHLKNYLGGDSIVKLVLNWKTCAQVITPVEATINKGDTYLFGCRTLTEAGEYADTLVSACGADSIVNLTLKVSDEEAYDTLVEAEVEVDGTFLFGCDRITAAGTYYDHLLNHMGGDSIVKLVLKWKTCTPVNTPIEATINKGEKYLFGCRTLTEAGEYTDTLVNACGADSIVKLTLKVDESKTIIVAEVDGDGSFLFGCRLITTDGIYEDTLQNGLGQDSIVQLNITFNTTSCKSASSINATITEDETFLFGCEQIKGSDIGNGNHKDYTMTLPNANAAGCDSIITLTLTVCKTEYKEIDVTIDDGETYLFGCRTLTEAGEYTDTLVNAAGCDSIVKLTLNVNVNSGCPAAVHNPTIQPSAQVGMLLNVDATRTELVNWYESNWNNNPANKQVKDVIISYMSDGQPTTIPTTPLGRELTDKQITLQISLDTNGECVVSPSFIYVDVDPIHVERDTLKKSVCKGSDEIVGKGALMRTLTINVDTTFSDTMQVYYDNNIEYYDSIYTYDFKILPTSYNTMAVTVCAGDSFLYAENNQYYQPQADPYTITLNTVAGCDSIITLTVNEYALLTGADTFYVCPGDMHTYVDGKKFAAGIHTDTIPSEVTGCDSIVTLNVIEYHAVLPFDFDTMPHAVCGKTFNVTMLSDSALAAIKADKLFAPIVAGSLEVQMKQADGTWTVADAAAMPAGVDEVTLRLKATSVTCGDIFSAEKVMPVEQPSATYLADYDNLPAATKYSDWILMVNLNLVKSTWNIDPKPEEITWYRMNGTTIDTKNDTRLGTGYYYTNDQRLAAGQYYAIIELAMTVADPCGATYRTVTITVTNPVGAPQLVPNRVQKGDQMILSELDPEVETSVLIYDAQGHQLQQLTSIGVSSLTIRAAEQAGLYIVKVKNDSQSEVLRYIVVK